MAAKTVKKSDKTTKKTQNPAKKIKKPEFNAKMVRATQEKEAIKLQILQEKRRKEVLARFQKETKERIALIPEWIMSAVKREARSKARALSCLDNNLGLEYISSKLDKSAAEKTILEFEPVKTVIEWATKKGFGYGISTCNGYWEMFLTW